MKNLPSCFAPRPMPVRRVVVRPIKIIRPGDPSCTIMSLIAGREQPRRDAQIKSNSLNKRVNVTSPGHVKSGSSDQTKGGQAVIKIMVCAQRLERRITVNLTSA